jgi:predicted dehydrogenase
MFFDAVTDGFADRCELVALCDVNQSRMDHWNGRLTDAGKRPAPTYKADRFDEMIAQARPDVVIVCTIDSEHDRYLVRAMELGCDVISEKPMTTDEHKCQRVLDAIERTGRRCTVTFNARYGPGDSKVKELLAADTIGRVLSVHYTHLLDVSHGADYFRRWHREKVNSGGLLLRECTHRSNQVNWSGDDVLAAVSRAGEVVC